MRRSLTRIFIACFVLALVWIGFDRAFARSADGSDVAEADVASLTYSTAGAIPAVHELVPRAEPLEPESIFASSHARKEASVEFHAHDAASCAAAGLAAHPEDLLLSRERARGLEELLETLREDHRVLRRETRGALLRAMKTELASGRGEVLAPGQGSHPDPDALFTGYTTRDGQAVRVVVHTSLHPELAALEQRELEHFQMAGAILADFLAPETSNSPRGSTR